MKDILEKSLYFGIDNLEIYIQKEEINFYNELVYEIDEDNSCSAYIELSDINFHYNKIHPKGYDYGYKFSMIWSSYDEIKNKSNHIIIDSFAINFLRPDKDGKVKIVLVLYSQLLTLYNQSKFDLITFLKQNFNFYQKTNYKRPDFCLDVSVDKGKILPYFKKLKSQINLGKDGYYETYYTRQILSDLNRLMTTRIYDKKSDTFKKKKGFLYTHLNNDNVNRIEVEIRKEYAKTIGYNIYDLLENISIQWQIFIDFINKDLKKENQLLFSHIEKIPFLINKSFEKKSYERLETRNFDLSLNYQKLGFIPKSYMDHANGYAKNILDQTGYDGFTQFILGNYFDDDKKQVRLPNGQLLYTCIRKPEILLLNIVEYFKNTLKMPQSKINNLLRPYISTKIKLNS